MKVIFVFLIGLFSFATVFADDAPPFRPPPPRPAPQPPRPAPPPRPVPPPQPGYYLQAGDNAYNISYNNAYVTVVGVQPDGRYIVRFEEGPYKGQIIGNWTVFDLAATYGCGSYFCVGEFARNRSRDYVRVRIIGLQYNGRYVLYFLEGPLSGLRGAHWNDYDLVR